jgi:hypothetical protein
MKIPGVVGVVALGWLLMGFSCTDEDGDCVDWGSCEAKRQADLACSAWLELDVDTLNPCVELSVHLDHIENQALQMDTICKSKSLMSLPCGSTYAFVARYKFQKPSGDTAIFQVLDDVDLKADKESRCDDEECYETPDANDDLELMPNYQLLPDSIRPR